MHVTLDIGRPKPPPEAWFILDMVTDESNERTGTYVQAGETKRFPPSG
jgi:hypothetical protein